MGLAGSRGRSNVAQVLRAKTVRKENHQQANANYESRHNGQHQVEPLKSKVHEVGDDQDGLDDRCSHQDHQHQHHTQVNITEKHLEASQKQQPDPNRYEELIASGEVIFGFSEGAHVVLQVTQILVYDGFNEQQRLKVWATHFTSSDQSTAS